jgi:hypothetical protein
MMTVTDRNLALSHSNLSESYSPTVIAECAVRTLEPCAKRPSMLIVSHDATLVNRVLSLVPAGAVELERMIETVIGREQLQVMTRSAALIVLVGPPGDLPWSWEEPCNKPVLWLPAPGGPPLHEAGTSAWHQGFTLALATALAQLREEGRHTRSLDRDARAWLEPVSIPSNRSREAAPDLDAAAGELRQGDRSVRVTPTECNLLRVLLASRGQWVPAQELRLRAFGPAHACHDSLIRVHVYKLRRKLCVLSAQILSAKGRGYMLD